MTPRRIKPPLPTRTREAATKLRDGMTDAERALWFRLRGSRLDGLKFRRQHPVPPYIVDFYCTEAKLVVELDGSQHSEEVDAVRTMALERRGLMVLRFWDNQVLADVDSVLREILLTARDRTLTRPCGIALRARSRCSASPGGRREKQREA